MKTMSGTWKMIGGVAILAASLVPLACGGLGAAQAQDVDAPGQEPIVGFWKVNMVSEGNNNIPDGTVLDSAFSQWHSDGTEIMNSSRPPATQSFCLGVWAIAGPLQYKLNHFAISWNAPGSSPSDLLGPANIHETITLSSDHNSFAGTFTIDQYNAGGTLLVHLAGNIEGKRITVDTLITDVL